LQNGEAFLAALSLLLGGAVDLSPKTWSEIGWDFETVEPPRETGPKLT
jgi:hypothetical protein